VQVLAVGLTYLAVCVRFVPPVFQGMGDAIRTSQVRNAPFNPTRPSAVAPPTDAPSPPTGQAGRTSVSTTALAYLAFTLLAWALVLASPFVAGPTLLGALSLVAGLWVAWRLNRATPVRGPFDRS
jgi:hypothetical protein